MKITFAVTGSERKALVTAISTTLNAPIKYLGMPTAAYEVGGYHIDKTGTLTGNDNELLIGELAEQGFNGEVTYENIYAESEERIGSGNWMGEPIEVDKITIEMPLDGFNPDKLDNLFRLVNSKDTLLKAALGAEDLPIQQTADTLSFPWFSYTEDGGTVNAYTTLIERLCKTAKEKQRITAKEHGDVENPKYAMRCCLLSLGFIGPEYKASRKILLNKLSGNSSWKSPKSEVTDNER
ncbi:hypothetical protein FACS1894219_11890 [Clostridia bacterium]|nr:hypothetical protein FACS1894219_11890 [Clostridia bacterium]